MEVLRVLDLDLKIQEKMLSDIPLIGKPTEKVLKAGVGAGLIGAGAFGSKWTSWSSKHKKKHGKITKVKREDLEKQLVQE